MKYITLDISKEKTQNMEEIITLATMMAVKKPGHIVRWFCPKSGLSYCVNYTAASFVISIGLEQGAIPSNNIETIQHLFSDADSSFWKQSSIDKYKNIFYLRWGANKCKEIKKAVE